MMSLGTGGVTSCAKQLQTQFSFANIRKKDIFYIKSNIEKNFTYSINV